MVGKIYYGAMPPLTDRDRPMFDYGNCVCEALFRTRTAAPVVVLHDRDMDIWKVQYGFSCVLFGAYDEAVAFCRSRFLPTGRA